MRHPNSYYLPENWPHHELRFSDPGMFVDIFKAGIKPHYIHGCEDSLVEMKHVRLTITDAYGQTYPELNCETLEVRPRKSGRIYDFQSISQPLTYDQAKKEMTPWLKYINISPAELDLFLSNVRKKPTGYDDPDFGTHKKGFGGGWTGKNKERYFVFFRKAYSYEVPVRVGFRVDWSFSMEWKEESNRYVDAIPAPEGYKIIEKSKDIGMSDFYEMMHAKGIPFMKGFGLGGEGTIVVERNEDGSYINMPAPSVTQLNAPPSQKIQLPSKSNWFAYFILAACFLAVSVIIFVVRRELRKVSH
jgi:hypothetical protein